MSQFSVCPDPSMFADSDGWEFNEPEPDEPAGLSAHWDEAAEGDMRYDIAEEQRLFPAPELAGVYAPGDGVGVTIRHPRRGLQARTRRRAGTGTESKHRSLRTIFRNP